jgi:hypothetical protein
MPTAAPNSAPLTTLLDIGNTARQNDNNVELFLVLHFNRPLN